MIKQKAAQGKTAYAISQELGISKNTALRYMADDVPARPKYCRASKLDPFKAKIDALMEQGIFNCVVILEHLQAAGYDGGGVQELFAQLEGVGAHDLAGDYVRGKGG